jgi:hypothetical protein
MSHKHTDSCKQLSGLKRRRRKKSASELAKAHKLQEDQVRLQAKIDEGP